MKAINQERYGSLVAKHFYNPGEQLSRGDFETMFGHLLHVNANRKQPIAHRYLDASLDAAERKALFASAFVGILYDGETPIGFLVSPIIRDEGITVVHAGLVVISSNYGEDLLGLLSLGLANMIHTFTRGAYVTNITSTPSILENFAKLVSKPWPDPDASLIRPPANYKKVFDILCNQYVLRHFPNPEKIRVDARRFVISTDSQGMGFNTNFRQLSRSANFKYLNFCLAWVDYEKEEDIIQVARFSWPVIMKARLLRLFLKYYVFPKKKNLRLKAEVITMPRSPESANHDLRLVK